MAENIFETLKERKYKLRQLIEAAATFRWIDAERREDMLKKLDTDTLTIGVIGQMKCGKSTFLNSFVFEDTILPAATTPMTAALSVITYGEKERIVAEFYTPDEWAEQKMQAARSIEEAQGNAAEESKIKAAKELVSKAGKLGSSLDSLLGKTQEDKFSNLIEYVGADGKYISITKSVTIYYPKDYLKGVEIVDTPGFNDPIVSREERTKEFLKRADVVLMMLYAGRPFDATDREIIFKNVRQCGIGKVLIGINKYDIPYCSETNPEDENQIKEYVISEIRKACRANNDNILSEILGETTPIPLSAEMALLSELPMSKITDDESLKFAWNRHCQNFGISTQAELRHWSHIADLTQAVKDMVVKEKDKILFSKPINAVIAAGSEKLAQVNKDIHMTTENIELLKMPDDELDDKETNLNKVERKLSKKISSLGDDIESELRNIIRKGRNTLEDDVDAACNKMRSIVNDEWGRFTNYDAVIRPRLEAVTETLASRTLRNSVEKLADKAKYSIHKCVSEFFNETEDTLMKYLPDFNSRDFVKGVKNKIQVEIEDNDLFKLSGDNSSQEGLSDFIAAFIDGATFGILSKLGSVISYNNNRAEAHETINSIKNGFDPTPYLEAVLCRKDEIISTVKTAFIDELIEPLQCQIQEIRTSKEDKASRIKSEEDKLSKLNAEKKQLESQIVEIESIKSIIN
ncbi:MAG: dynamin family protein [Duncaniella sp.]|nr:dynamin family protein [Duncaniella sp.]